MSDRNNNELGERRDKDKNRESSSQWAVLNWKPEDSLAASDERERKKNALRKRWLFLGGAAIHGGTAE